MSKIYYRNLKRRVKKILILFIKKINQMEKMI